MSLQKGNSEYALEERGFFIASETERDWDEEDNVDHKRLILLKADALASENRLKDAVDVFSMALRHDYVRPDQLSTLVDCILRNFKRKSEDTARVVVSHQNRAKDSEFNCPGCHRFLGEPVTIACGHSYCKGCLRQSLFSKCKLCSEDIGTRPEVLRPNVILCGLLEKLFPNDFKRIKTLGEVEGLLQSEQFDEAVSLASNLLESDPDDVWARVYRAEAHLGLKQHDQALEDLDVWLSGVPTAEGYFRKAKILQEVGRVDESLQVFLQCLALDESLSKAKREVERILYDLLSPVGENVTVGLRETAQNASPHLRSKILAGEAQVKAQNQQREEQSHCQSETHTASAQSELQQKVNRAESLERTGLNRAHSLRARGLEGAGEEGLKRVCSAPQLGDQEKSALLKRKLSISEAAQCVVYSNRSKHKKQGGADHERAVVTNPRRTVTKEQLDSNDLECSLCMRLFFEPVTTPCGHTFCKSCLERCLDHTPQCPLCKESLKEYLATRKYSITAILDDIIKRYLSEEHSERQKVHIEETKELSDLTKNVPIFVCTMAYPTVPCPLHVFEPRYRLMIRRCMETGTRQFGMCINDPQKGFVDYGCMLQIRSVHFLPDGRSVVDTIGGKRFRVLSRGMRDGYCIADIEYLEDTKVNGEEELVKLQELHDQVYEQARTWFQNLKNRFRNQILQHFGPMPEREADIQATPNGPACCWWLLAVLPVDPRYQLSVLSMTTLKERLVKIQHILTYLQNIPNE
ncbi:LON peptidase N-terminal domain and RING finger protein 1 [Chanos chanos]|uniref:LON peptidase N-terminal domain and RING finger protein 1 n=1 Tax=Chanos chanos TaxID=29144 RepID=A0A6J2VF84_CHACN|nr:LON peptidase N-terminal domain and RING finger protein 1 [Chanos chanos]